VESIAQADLEPKRSNQTADVIDGTEAGSGNLWRRPTGVNTAGDALFEPPISPGRAAGPTGVDFGP